MNLAIIGSNDNSGIKNKGLKSSKSIMKVMGEYPVERIIRIGRSSRIKKIFCLINPNEQELKHYLSTNNFGIPVKLFVQDTENYTHSLFVLAPFLMKEPFFLVTMDMVFLDSEFSEFVTYSLLQEDADGALAVTRYLNDKKPLGVAMNDEDTILKFNDSKDGYSWFNGGIYYFSPKILNEINYAFQSDISTIEKFLHILIVRGHILKGLSFSKIIKVENASDIAKAEELIRGNE